MKMAPRDNAMYNISYCTSLYMHNDLISDLDLFQILDAIFYAIAFKFDKNVVVRVSFGGFC